MKKDSINEWIFMLGIFFIIALIIFAAAESMLKFAALFKYVFGAL